MRSFASHATVQAWRHSPSTKRMTVPLGPGGPGGPAGPAAPGGPGSPFSPWEAFSSQAESTRGASSKTMINERTCMRSPTEVRSGMRTVVYARKRAPPWRHSPMRGALGGADPFGGWHGSAVQTLHHEHVTHAKGPGAAG